ncbi:hypothetical protein M569_12871, partial [Genlisea aurea]
GWKSMDTILAAEKLALALQAGGQLKEAEEVLDRCLDACKGLLPPENIQNAVIMLYIAKGKLANTDQLIKTDVSKAMSDLDKAKDLLYSSIRVARNIIEQRAEAKGKKGNTRNAGRDAQAATLTLLQTLDALASLEITKLKFLGAKEYSSAEAESAIQQCISYYKLTAYDSALLKAEYLSCLRRISNLTTCGVTMNVGLTEKELNEEIRRVENEVSKS